MILVVDSSVWSLSLRRQRVDPDDPWVGALRGHGERGDEILLMGIIVQEVLSGVRTPSNFSRLLSALQETGIAPVSRDTHVLAARIHNDCRRNGVRTGAVDALITACCVENDYPLLAADRDFIRIANCCDLKLLPPLV